MKKGREEGEGFVSKWVSSPVYLIAKRAANMNHQHEPPRRHLPIQESASDLQFQEPFRAWHFYLSVFPTDICAAEKIMGILLLFEGGHEDNILNRPHKAPPNLFMYLGGSAQFSPAPTNSYSWGKCGYGSRRTGSPPNGLVRYMETRHPQFGTWKQDLPAVGPIRDEV